MVANGQIGSTISGSADINYRRKTDSPSNDTAPCSACVHYVAENSINLRTPCLACVRYEAENSINLRTSGHRLRTETVYPFLHKAYLVLHVSITKLTNSFNIKTPGNRLRVEKAVFIPPPPPPRCLILMYPL